MNAKKLILGIFILFALLWMGIKYLDRSLRESMDRSYLGAKMEEDYYRLKVTSISRRIKDSTVYGFMRGGVSADECFWYERGFHKYLEVGDMVSKKKGEYRITVIKEKDSATFDFKPRYCATPYHLMADSLYIVK